MITKLRLSKVRRAWFSALEDASQTEAWLKKLNDRATSPEGKAAVGQLSSLVTYYNKEAETVPEEIDWKGWSDRLQTRGLVEKVRANYEALSAQEYQATAVMKEVAAQESQEFRALNSELFYHQTLWMVFYKHNLHYHVQVQAMPLLKDMTLPEQQDFYQERQIEDERCYESRQVGREVFQDLPVKQYLMGQFNWGKAVVSFWRHPSEDYKGVKGTKSIFGR